MFCLPFGDTARFHMIDYDGGVVDRVGQAQAQLMWSGALDFD